MLPEIGRQISDTNAAIVIRDFTRRHRRERERVTGCLQLGADDTVVRAVELEQRLARHIVILHVPHCLGDKRRISTCIRVRQRRRNRALLALHVAHPARRP